MSYKTPQRGVYRGLYRVSGLGLRVKGFRVLGCRVYAWRLYDLLSKLLKGGATRDYIGHDRGY